MGYRSLRLIKPQGGKALVKKGGEGVDDSQIWLAC